LRGKLEHLVLAPLADGWRGTAATAATAAIGRTRDRLGADAVHAADLADVYAGAAIELADLQVRLHGVVGEATDAGLVVTAGGEVLIDTVPEDADEEAADARRQMVAAAAVARERIDDLLAAADGVDRRVTVRLAGHLAEPTPEVGIADPQEQDEYTVRRGDTLFGIASDELGDPLRWPEIYDLNRGRRFPVQGGTLSDPDLIY